jgi:hypothetical protein
MGVLIVLRRPLRETVESAEGAAVADEEDTEAKDTGAAKVESTGEAAVAAATDEEDMEGKETMAAKVESAGEAAATVTRDEEDWAGKGAAAPPASVGRGVARAATVEVEAPTQTADGSNCTVTDSPVAEAGTAEAAASILERICERCSQM